MILWSLHRRPTHPFFTASFSGIVLNPAQISMRKYLMGLRILAALIIVSRASFFGILIAAMGCTPPLRNNYARYGTTTIVRARAHPYTHIHTHIQSTYQCMHIIHAHNTRPHTHSHISMRKLRCVRAIPLQGWRTSRRVCISCSRDPIWHDGITRATPL